MCKQQHLGIKTVLVLLGSITILSSQEIVDVSQFPYIVSIQIDGLHKCGGLIYDESTVLTKLDCMLKFDSIQNVTVVAGRMVAEERGHEEQLLKAKDLLDKLDQRIQKSKLVILTLSGKFKWSPFVQPTRIQTRWDSAKNERFSTVGWTCIWSNQEQKCVLYQTASIRNESTCAGMYRNYRPSPAVFCAHRESCDIDQISYDSVLVNTKSEALGILYTQAQCEAKANIYLNLTYYNEQIKRNLEGIHTTFMVSPSSKASVTTTVKIRTLSTLPVTLPTRSKTRTSRKTIRTTIPTEDIEPDSQTTTNFPKIHHPETKEQEIRNDEQDSSPDLSFIVALDHPYAEGCTGVIIHENMVLTTACCIDEMVNLGEWRVIVGRIRSENGETGQIFQIVSSYMHKDYQGDVNDIGIVRIDGKFTFDRSVKLARLGRQRPSLRTSEVSWSARRDEKFYNLKLDTAVIEDDEVCSSRYGEKYNTTTMVCVTHSCRESESKRRHKGDPLLLSNSFEVLGLFSFGRKGCEKSPAIYVDVTAFNSWIKDQYEKTERLESINAEVPVSLQPIFASPQLEATSPTIIITLLCLVTLLFLSISCFLLLRKKLHRNKAKKMQPRKISFEDEVLGEESTKSHAFKRYRSWVRGEIDTGWRNSEVPDDEWEVPRDDIIMIKLLGEGFFGQVWKCEASRIKGFRKPTVVAVKTIKEIACEKERDALLAEIQVMKELERHLNVISIFGCCTEKDPVLLIMEYVNGGSLLECLRRWRSERENHPQASCSSAEFASNDVTIFSHQIASGMEFLSSKSIVHRDLAARNVLLDTNNKICKIADFGFARVTKTDRVYEKKSDGLLPIRWLAPESLTDGIYTTKSDVWSFGILVWEIVTLGSTPYPGMSAGDVMMRVKNGYHLEQPDHCKQELYRIMRNCWDVNPIGRPTFAQLVKRFDKLICSEMEYVDLNSFLDCSYYNVITQSTDEKI